MICALAWLRLYTKLNAIVLVCKLVQECATGSVAVCIHAAMCSCVLRAAQAWITGKGGMQKHVTPATAGLRDREGSRHALYGRWADGVEVA